jgi:predicted transcriptional regulator
MPSDPRVLVTFRLAAKGRDWLDALADSEDSDRSKVMRAALAVARAHGDEVRRLVRNWKDAE